MIASPNLLNNDNLTIYCQITNILSLTTESSKVANSQLSKLTQKCLLGVNRAFGSLFQSRTFSDVQFEFANHPETLPGHKLILSIRSPVFERMFSHQEMRENQTNIVTIVDIKIEVFREMFRFIYTGTVMEIERFDEELLIAADKVRPPEINFLFSNLKPKTKLQIVVVSNRLTQRTCSTIPLRENFT